MLERVASYDALQLLLYLRAASPQSYESAALCQYVMVSQETIAAALQQLHSARLLVQEHRGTSFVYRYAPANAEMAALVDELARCCADRPLALVRVMTMNALQRLRGRSVDRFARVLRGRDRTFRADR